MEQEKQVEIYLVKGVKEDWNSCKVARKDNLNFYANNLWEVYKIETVKKVRLNFSIEV